MTTTATTTAEPLPKFEQTMQGLLALAKDAPRDSPFTHGMLLDWLLPLIEDARDEYHGLAEDAADRTAELEEAMDEMGSAQDSEETRVVVVALVGLLSLAYQRSGWMDDKLALTSTCPKDLADEFTKVQALVQAWAQTQQGGEAE